MRHLIEILNDPNRSTADKIDAASKLWYLSHRAQDAVKQFKATLTAEADEVNVTVHEGSKSKALVIPQPRSPSLEGLSRAEIMQALGEELYYKYIAESLNVRWSKYQLEENTLEVDEILKRLPPKPLTYQVRFVKKED